MRIRPFRIQVPDSDLADLRTRLTAARWPAQLSGEAWHRGVPVDYLRALAAYWADGFDWRAQEAELNSHPQFHVEIDGQTVHFLHVKSAERDARPLILLHGWPGSVVEFLDIIGPLTDPRAHGDDSAHAYHLVIPSLVGFGYSTPLSDSAWTVPRMATAFTDLMAALGYDRYGVQGGDYGSVIGPLMGALAPDRVMGVHLNGPAMVPMGPISEDDAASMTDLERERLARAQVWMSEMTGYSTLQGTRPQTVGFALTDSPVGQLAWIVEKFKEWTDSTRALPEDAVSRDRMLANISVYWFTGTATSSANLYYETMHMDQTKLLAPSPVPMGVAVFKQDFAIRRFGDLMYNIVHWSDFDTGGHFAAMETPGLLVDDIRKFFAGLS